MSEWKEYRFTEAATLTNGRAYLQPELQEAGKYKIVRVGNLSGGDNWFYSDLELPEDKYCHKGDLLYAWACSFGPYIWNEDKTIYHYHIWKVDVNKALTDKYYLYYYLKYYTPKWMGLTNGSVMMHITKGSLEKQLIRLPDLNTQRQIASILSSLDDKIAVNKKICENLEAQAQALFKHWFVDFAPFKDGKFVESELGLIPEGWRVGVIGDYCVIRSGFAFKSSWWQDEGVKVVKIKNITDGGTLDMSDCSCVSEEHASLASSFQTKSGDLLIAMTGATIGKFCVVNGQETYCVNQRVGKFFLGDNPLEKLPFIYCILKRDDVYKEIVNKGQGSAQPNISGKDIEEIKIIIPPQSIIKQFNEELYSSFELRINGELENHRLSTLRDTLLPKLMSGQIKL